MRLRADANVVVLTASQDESTDSGQIIRWGSCAPIGNE